MTLSQMNQSLSGDNLNPNLPPDFIDECEIYEDIDSLEEIEEGTTSSIGKVTMSKTYNEILSANRKIVSRCGDDTTQMHINIDEDNEGMISDEIASLANEERSFENHEIEGEGDNTPKVAIVKDEPIFISRAPITKASQPSPQIKYLAEKRELLK
jgi:hypothetical protein